MVDYERALDDLGFRHTEEEVLEPAARAWWCPSRRQGEPWEAAAAAGGGGAKLGFRGRNLCA